MATNLKTIKFGESGETYCVNEWPVQVSGTLDADASEIDFGAFDGLTEVNIAMQGVADAEGNYCFVTVNGVQSAFIARYMLYKGQANIQVKKIGDVWQVLCFDSVNGVNTDVAYKLVDLLAGADSITSISLQSYSGTDFPAGMKYALEGR